MGPTSRLGCEALRTSTHPNTERRRPRTATRLASLAHRRPDRTIDRVAIFLFSPRSFSTTSSNLARIRNQTRGTICSARVCAIVFAADNVSWFDQVVKGVPFSRSVTIIVLSRNFNLIALLLLHGWVYYIVYIHTFSIFRDRHVGN